jgi:hypothetical protein
MYGRKKFYTIGPWVAIRKLLTIILRLKLRKRTFIVNKNLKCLRVIITGKVKSDKKYISVYKTIELSLPNSFVVKKSKFT